MACLLALCLGLIPLCGCLVSFQQVLIHALVAAQATHTPVTSLSSVLSVCAMHLLCICSADSICCSTDDGPQASDCQKAGLNNDSVQVLQKSVADVACNHGL